MLTDHIRYSDQDHNLLLLDQRYLPMREETFACRHTADIIYALQTMVVRGAPAIGVTAAYGCCLALREVGEGKGWEEALAGKLQEIENARPTAVNLRWAVRRMREVWKGLEGIPAAGLAERWLLEAKTIHQQDIEANQAMGRFGADLIADGDTVLTHCNAGALATAGHGTAVGVIYSAWQQGKRIKVIADETRPFLQGARLTAYEVHKACIPVTVACDNACALLMHKGLVQKVVVGADRIAANGDAANKIGTFGVAIIAKEFGIPFYVAAPVSTIDPETLTGAEIPIEERPAREVTHVGDTQITPSEVPVYNFAFDVTPNRLIAGIITDKGVLRPPYTEAIKKLFEK